MVAIITAHGVPARLNVRIQMRHLCRYTCTVSMRGDQLGNERKGIGGIFFKSDDPKNLYAWYEKHLGIEASVDGTGANFGWRDAQSRRLKGKSSPSR
jgi:hypothetical protein